MNLVLYFRVSSNWNPDVFFCGLSLAGYEYLTCMYV